VRAHPPIAQLVEQLPLKEMVPGSSPGGRTKDRNTCPAAGFLLLSEAQRCFCLSEAKGKNRELGSRDFSVRKNTCDDTVRAGAIFFVSKKGEAGSRKFLNEGEEIICDDTSEAQRCFCLSEAKVVTACDESSKALQSPYALVAELVYARALGARSERIRGSSPLGGTKRKKYTLRCIFFDFVPAGTTRQFPHFPLYRATFKLDIILYYMLQCTLSGTSRTV